MVSTETCYDVGVIGAGIAGAALAAELSCTHRVILLEQEDQPGYHATGRSAAVFTSIYGNETVRALTRASRTQLLYPSPSFTDTPFVAPLGCMFIARPDQLTQLTDFHSRPDIHAATQWLDAAQARHRCPLLRPGHIAAAVEEPDALSIDVHALQQAYLRQFRQQGGLFLTRAQVMGMTRQSDTWQLTLPQETVRCRIVVNAAGAWADHIAALAGQARSLVQPMRRTAVLVDVPPGTAIETFPLVIDIDEEFYFKPDAGLLLVSPADETPSDPCDAQPEEWDIAVAIDRLMNATSLEVQRVRHAWAGLRSFSPDRTPIAGPDPELPAFFWCAGQGGYGIQTAPALARLLASRIRCEPCPADIVAEGLSFGDLDPARPSLAT
jgi:D-arginine dehydrogenase